MSPFALLVLPRGPERAVWLREVADRLARQGSRVGGFVQHVVDPETRARVLQRLSDGAEIPLGRRGQVRDPTLEEVHCSFVFERRAFEVARAWLIEDAGTADVLVIDELGKVESAREGHFETAAWALASDLPAVVLLSVRGDQLFALADALGLDRDAVAILDATAPDPNLGAFVEAVGRARQGSA
ncbi:MAG: DUF2478 domain-containing protein [Deltaproteobacteria bacterium]|nr:DUF2478 domain-containing protein [Deltaproteobacteria bacterium]